MIQFNAAKAVLDAAGIQYRPILWWSQGINNMSLHNAAIWKAATESIFADFRTAIAADLPILLTNFNAPLTVYSPITVYNTVIDEIVAAQENTYLIDTSGFADAAQDTAHWSYENFRVMVERIIDQTEGAAGTATAPSFSPVAGVITEDTEITLSAPAGSIYYTTDGSLPHTGKTLYSGPFTVSPGTTVRAIAVARGYKNSNVASALYNAPHDYIVMRNGDFIVMRNGDSITIDARP